MFRKLLVAATAFFLLPALLLAQDGKLRGTVTDKESGEPLIGANVTIEGTNLGASTDLNGEYVILSVPAGAYSVKASYIGYAAYTISNLRVNANLTTSQNFALSSTAIQVQAVEVVAERPLIQRNTTNTVRIQTQEDIKNLPVRGVQTLASLNAGVVNQGGNMYVRGGRNDEVSYYVDGANITNPFNGGQSRESVGLIQEALEEIQLQTGGYTAEFGGANSGIIRTTSRTGGSKFNVSLDYRTDDFAKPGDQFLSTSAFGYHNAVLTVGGPVINGVRFFVAGQNNYIRNRQTMFLEPFKFQGLVDDGLNSAANSGLLLPDSGTVEYKRNYLYNNWNQTNSANGNVLFDLNQLANIPIKVRFLGSYSEQTNPNSAAWPGGLSNYFFSANRSTMSENKTYFANLRVTHVLSPTTFYELGVSMQRLQGRTYDPDFTNYMDYPDSAANAKAGFNTSAWRNRYQGPTNWSTIFNFQFVDPNAPNNSYSKYRQDGLGFTVDLTSQVSSNWELKVGGALDSWTYRSFSIGNISALRIYLDPNRDGVNNPAAVASAYAKRIDYLRTAGIVTYGYDYLGKSTDGYTLSGSPATLDAPYKPLFASAYVQNKYEYKDLILNFGARYEFYDPKFKVVPPTINPATGLPDYQNIANDANLKIIDESQVTTTDPTSLLLPRVSFSFPVTDRTVFYTQYGKYAQEAALSTYYQSAYGFSNAINPGTRSPYGGAVGFDVKPERTTLFETGIRQILTDNLAFTLTGFYKDIKDQIQIRRYYNSVGNPLFTAYENADFGTVKGLELTLNLRRTERLAVRFNYTLSDAVGTGSSPGSNSVATSDELKARFPNFVSSLPFNQTHVGSLMLDYRFGQGDGGKVLEGMGLNLLATFNSGHNYTKIAEPQNLGQASPWNIGVRALLDARFRNPEEPVNASSTPWVFNIDLTWNKVFYLSNMNVELYVNVLNLLNTQQILNLYPTTGTAQDDGWLKSPFAAPYKALENYTDFYKAVNLANRWGIMQTFVGDVYGSPRQIRLGARIEY